MEAYIYKASLYCVDCAMAMSGAVPPASPSFAESKLLDSDTTIIGPYLNGGGEADSPQHCDGCRCHLENPLTDDGVEYVISAIERDDGDQAVLRTWIGHYGDAIRNKVDLFLAYGEVIDRETFLPENSDTADSEFLSDMFDCVASGMDATDACEYMVRVYRIVAHPTSVREYLRSFGAWGDDRLADDSENVLRAIWIIAGNLREAGEDNSGLTCIEP